ncbi:UTP--glucose-1-phosphate uridylyltransferase [Rubripirellula reticaptiva]|uniref:Putative uridylyltransferase n=1 Tax=Rubripirellula reticaptiva TaxID=2528013 RepID=A0A5C6FEP9_9BACT|nr:UDPGP type 1 family protein [Rubripirellula reticaptiva]TWU58061.1 putative uridylyltransferase [Rubripirellula reticaptiva]
MTDSNVSRQALQARLAPFGQDGVLRFWDELDSAGQSQLASQIQDLDLDQLATLLAGEDVKQDFAAMADRAMSPPSVLADGTGAAWSVEEAVKHGEAALAAGEVGAILVAGGQGTRLGFDQPKGMFPAGPVSNRTLFQIFADRLIAIGRRYNVEVPWYVMTSDATDADTRIYFESNGYLGLNPDQVRIFKQGTMPAVDAATGKLLLASKDSLALSPDGHGGTVRALDKTGCLDDADARGVKYLAYIQVDNPLANLCDPALIGHHVMAASEMTTQVVRKRFATEKVGNIVLVDGKVNVIEYSDLPETSANATAPDGSLKLWAGSIGIHVIDVAFLRRMSRSADALPFHRASKKVGFVDESGLPVEPTEPNATKFERFIFDLLPSAENAFVVEALPSEAFAPIKNAEGAPTDTASLARKALSDLHKSWLVAAGAEVADGIQVEINPRFALSADELREKIPTSSKIDSDHYFDA